MRAHQPASTFIAKLTLARMSSSEEGATPFLFSPSFRGCFRDDIAPTAPALLIRHADQHMLRDSDEDDEQQRVQVSPLAHPPLRLLIPSSPPLPLLQRASEAYASPPPISTEFQYAFAH
jgi:hypothetical protein